MAIERRLYGTFNLTGRPMGFRQFLESCKTATRSDAEFVWIPGRFLREHGLETDAVLQTFAGNFPFWRPDPDNRGLYQVSSEKAYRAGWRTRSFEETALDCLDEFHSQIHCWPTGAIISGRTRRGPCWRRGSRRDGPIQGDLVVIAHQVTDGRRQEVLSASGVS